MLFIIQSFCFRVFVFLPWCYCSRNAILRFLLLITISFLLLLLLSFTFLFHLCFCSLHRSSDHRECVVSLHLIPSGFSSTRPSFAPLSFLFSLSTLSLHLPVTFLSLMFSDFCSSLLTDPLFFSTGRSPASVQCAVQFRPCIDIHKVQPNLSHKS